MYNPANLDLFGALALPVHEYPDHTDCVITRTRSAMKCSTLCFRYFFISLKLFFSPNHLFYARFLGAQTQERYSNSDEEKRQKRAG